MTKKNAMTKSAADKVEDIEIRVREIHKATGTTVAIYPGDWDHLRRWFRLRLRVPHDESKAFLDEVPVRRHDQ